MDEMLTGLIVRLRGADSFSAVAAAVIERLARVPGVTSVAVEAHDRSGPNLWYATAGFTPPAGYLDVGRMVDPLLAASPAVVEPRADPTASTWLCPLIGCGEVVGAVRLRVAPGAAVADLLAQVCTLVSVRVAQLGGSGDDGLGADTLTARQYEVSVLVARGSTNAEIGRLLSISADAVKKHVSRALVALEVSNRAELAAIAGRWRWTPPAAAMPMLHTERRRAARPTQGRARAA